MLHLACWDSLREDVPKRDSYTCPYYFTTYEKASRCLEDYIKELTGRPENIDCIRDERTNAYTVVKCKYGTTSKFGTPPRPLWFQATIRELRLDEGPCNSKY